MPFDPIRFAQWRRTVPWTDTEIAAALEAQAIEIEHENPWLAGRGRFFAGLVLKGRLSAKILMHVLPYLIRTCALCGKRALYRTGFEGRCSTHRMIPAAFEREREARREALNRQQDEYQRSRNERDRRHVAGFHGKRKLVVHG